MGAGRWALSSRSGARGLLVSGVGVATHSLVLFRTPRLYCRCHHEPGGGLACLMAVAFIRQVAKHVCTVCARRVRALLVRQ